jgi:hypothetical protein
MLSDDWSLLQQSRHCMEAAVKKLLLLVAAGAGAFAVWRKIEADKAEQDLWAEATDDVG